MQAGVESAEAFSRCPQYRPGRMTDPSLLECHGGPWDGRLIVDRGPQFPVTFALTHDGTLQPSHRNAGVYKRRSDGYYWRPNVE
jgi:hypothetical protein